MVTMEFWFYQSLWPFELDKLCHLDERYDGVGKADRRLTESSGVVVVLVSYGTNACRLPP